MIYGANWVGEIRLEKGIWGPIEPCDTYSGREVFKVPFFARIFDMVGVTQYMLHTLSYLQKTNYSLKRISISFTLLKSLSEVCKRRVVNHEFYQLGVVPRV